MLGMQTGLWVCKCKGHAEIVWLNVPFWASAIKKGWLILAQTPTSKKRPESPDVFGRGGWQQTNLPVLNWFSLSVSGSKHLYCFQTSSFDSDTASFSMTGGCVDGPGLHLSFTKQGVDQCSQHIDGSSDVKHGLPFFESVLGIFSTTNR